MVTKFFKVFSFTLLMAFYPIAYAQGGYCTNLYSQFYDCSANSFMINTPACKEVFSRWSSSGCTANVCNSQQMFGGGNPPFLNCGVDKSRYDYCMNQKLGQGQGWSTPEQYCQGWAGPAQQCFY